MAEKSRTVAVGQVRLMALYDLKLPLPAVTSTVGPGARRRVEAGGRREDHYPHQYLPSDSLEGHLRFALRYEPIDLAVMAALFKACDARELEAWIRREPNGAYARRAWFLYEWLTGRRLDLPDAGGLAYVDALNPDFHVVAAGVPSRRHKVSNNLLGSPGFCPIIRCTKQLKELMAEPIEQEAAALIQSYDQQTLIRAVSYLYTKETKSSYAIEGETASAEKAERFIAALHDAKSFDPTKKEDLLKIQTLILDPRTAEYGYRTRSQVYIGPTRAYQQMVDFIGARPQEVEQLMDDWSAAFARLRGAAPAVVEAAILAFGFVFIHPFEDGNGRTHRFLIHHILSTEGFTPSDVIFPVSAAILRDRKGYGIALESFSKAVMPFIDWTIDRSGEVTVNNETGHLYRYFDATPIAEFLYAKVIETVRVDLKNELEFVEQYDIAYRVVNSRIDLPGRRLNLFVQILIENNLRISRNKRRRLFGEFSDEEIDRIEDAVREAMEDRHDKDDDPEQGRPGGFRR